MSANELTTADVAERLGRPERTVRLWCKQGLLPGAHVVNTPRGDYWLVPASALKDFEPPPLGRRPAPKASGADGRVIVKTGQTIGKSSKQPSKKSGKK